MNNQHEYEIFLEKLLEKIRDIRSDFHYLSEENQQRFIQETNALCRSFGYTIAIEDLMRKYDF